MLLWWLSTPPERQVRVLLDGQILEGFTKVLPPIFLRVQCELALPEGGHSSNFA